MRRAGIESLQALGMAAVERRVIALRDRTYAGLMQIPRLRVVSPPPGPLANALLACALPDELDSMALRETLLTTHGIVVKMIEKHRFNGIRLSPHVLNTEADVDAVLQALRTELA